MAPTLHVKTRLLAAMMLCLSGMAHAEETPVVAAKVADGATHGTAIQVNPAHHAS